MKKTLAILATLLAVVTAGCSAEATPEPGCGEAAAPSLHTLREAAGIPDCPDPEPRDQVLGGLPDDAVVSGE